jgi:hypothetical protein
MNSGRGFKRAAGSPDDPARTLEPSWAKFRDLSAPDIANSTENKTKKYPIKLDEVLGSETPGRMWAWSLIRNEILCSGRENYHATEKSEAIAPCKEVSVILVYKVNKNRKE